MPLHDWTRVEAGIFHAFHHRWISAISDVLNEGILPPEYYALPEQFAAGFGPAFQATAQTDMEFYRRKQNSIVVRHVSGDRVIAMIEIVSPGNKSTRHAFRSFIDKATQLLENGVHLLLIDPFTFVSYEAGMSVRAFVRQLAAGDPLPDMPLFLKPNACVTLPLESTYLTAFAAQPSRWRQVLEKDR
jgi:hypothetical protein